MKFENIKLAPTLLSLSLLLVGVFSSSDLSARILSPDEALKRAIPEISFKKAPSRFSNMKFYGSRESSNGIPCLYIFSSDADKGFVITTADDRLSALLGYSGHGHYDLSSLPPALRGLLQDYVAEIEYFYDNHETVKYPLPAVREDMAEIPPLVKTVWGQEAPFDMLCPEIGDKKTVVGCVATSTAQVVNYHKWPQSTGEGTYRFTWYYKEYGQQYSKRLSFDYGSTSFDWANMLDSYFGSEGNLIGTEAQRLAPATLSYAIGVGVEMDYNTAEAGGSGAVSLRIPRVLIENLGFDTGIRYIQRHYYNGDWDALIYNELAASRPVILGGAGDLGGHSFICDGYQSDGLFHINWGWNGSSDGYYRLSALNPESLGVGGGSGGFNRQQDVIIGICPPNANPGPKNPFVISNGAPDMSVSTSGIRIANTGDLSGSYFYTLNWVPTVFSPALKLIDENGEETFISSSTSYEFPSLDRDLSMSIFKSFNISVKLSTLNPGKYTAYPMVECDGGIFPINFPQYTKNYQFLVVEENGKAYFTDEGEPGTSGMTAVRPQDSLYDVFTPQGRLVAKGIEISAIRNLDRGIYILRNGEKTLKISNF